MKKILLPHISRIMPARIFVNIGNSLAIGMTLGFVMLNAYAWSRFVPPYWNAVVAVLKNPGKENEHMALAQAYWDERILTSARQELLLADTLGPPVLGATTAQTLLAQWKYEQEKLLLDYRHWQTVIREKSDYRDAYVTLASLAYQLSRTHEARYLLKKALQLDPNFRTAQEFSLAIVP
jgi:tetratricopeptide (TPR) repeat protein